MPDRSRPAPLVGALLLATLLATPVPPAAAGAPAGPAAPPAAPAPVAAVPLTVRQAVTFALANSPPLLQNANRARSGQLTAEQRRADFQPELGLGVSASERFEHNRGDGEGRNYENVSGDLNASVNLFNGFGDVAALRGAEWSAAGLRDSYTRAEQTLIFETVTAYLRALSARELIGVRRENLEGNRRQLEQVEALYRVGNRPVSDLYQQQAETAGAELDLVLAERDDRVARLELLRIIGLSPAIPLELRAPDLTPLENALLAREEAAPEVAALEQRADLQAAGKELEAAREEVAVARAGHWPTLRLTAGLGSDYTSLDRSGGFTRQFFDDRLGAAIGLNLNVPLYDRRQTRTQVAQARLREDDARLTVRLRRLQAEEELVQVVEDFRTAQKLVGVTGSRLTASRQALAAMEERYRVGAATLVELTQARAQFAAAGYERVKARYGLISQGVATAYYRGDSTGLHTLLTTWESL